MEYRDITFDNIIFERIWVNRDLYKSQKEYNQVICEKAKDLVESGVYAFEIHDPDAGIVLKVDGFNDYSSAIDTALMAEWETVCKRDSVWKTFEDTYCYAGGFDAFKAKDFGITPVINHYD